MLFSVIRRWLKKRLDITVRAHLEDFIKLIQDGSILAQILHHYDIITGEELQSVEESQDLVVMQDNYSKLQSWLTRLEFELNDSDVVAILNQESASAVGLFYELYMKLENDEELMRPKDTSRRFLVENVPEFKKDPLFIESNPLCEPILNQWDVINWQRDRLAAVMKKYVETKEEYREYLQRKERKVEKEELVFTADSTDFTYDQLVAQQEKCLQLGEFQPSEDEARRIMKQIKERNRERAKRKAERTELQHEFMADIWRIIEQFEEEELDKEVCSKLLKQSKHEKEVAEKLLKVREEKQKFLENKRLEDEMERKRRDEEFIRRLLEDETQQRLDFHDEKTSILTEHRRLYEQKLRLKASKHEKVCRDVVYDVIDLSLKTAEFRQEFGMGPDKFTEMEWYQLFIKQGPILDLVEPLPAIEEEPEVEPIKHTQNFELLNDEDFDDYVHFRHLWATEDDLQDVEAGMNCFGYAVHRLLLKKYPLPLPQKPDLPAQIEVSVCTNLADLTRLDLLQRILSLRQIKVIRIEDATDFCIRTYETELKTEFDEPFPEEDYLREIGATAKETKDNKKKKGKKAKDKDSKSSKGSKGKKDKKGKKEQKEEVVRTYEEKQAQTPKLFPWEKVVFSNRAKLGRTAKQLLGQDEAINDKLLVEMFIEYLQSMPDIKGWVLINYPQNYAQAMMLEQALTGKPMPKHYLDEILNAESLASVKIEENQPISEVEEEEIYYTESTVQTLSEEAPSYTEKNSPLMSCETEETMSNSYAKSAEEIVEELLPDLKHLAYFDREKPEEISDACHCTCRRMSSEEIDEGLDDCLCFLVKSEPEYIPPDVKNQTTQTDILGLELTSEDRAERVPAVDIYEEKRLSKIVPNPRPLEKEEYATVLTAFIRIEEKLEEDEDYPFPKYDFAKKCGLDKFYADQGCFYLLQFEEFSSETMKCLAKMIVGDYSLPLKNSVELFGEKYKEALVEDAGHVVVKKGKGAKKEKKGKKTKEKKAKSGTKVEKASKKSKGKKSDKSKASKKGKKKEVTEVPIEHDEKETQVPEPEELEEEEMAEPKPGEANWEYVNLPIPEDIQLNLATMWDSFEEQYVANFKGMFNQKRLLLNEVYPYLANVREKMKEFVGRPDQKQFYLREFQQTLNQIDLEMRQDAETKNELLCLIDEFQDKLLNICDDKMKESEEERCKHVTENWFFRQFCELSNLFSIPFQLEMDRLVQSLQFLSDYYIAMITKTTKVGYSFHQELLPKLECEEAKSTQFNKIFIEMDHSDCETEFHEYIETCRNLALGFVQSLKPLALKPLEEMKKLFEAPIKEKKPKKNKKEKKFEPDEDVKENSDRIFAEWQCALSGEFARIEIKLKSIKNELCSRLTDVITRIKANFCIIFDDIKRWYQNDTSGIYKACRILAEAAEQELIIKPELTFEGDRLAQIYVTLFPEEAAPPNRNFTLEQLDYMVRILMDLAPGGFIMRQTFLLLIQDILYQDELEGLWRNLSASALNALFGKIFDDVEYLYWKNFILFNLLEMPTRQELMDVRSQFRSFDEDLKELVTFDDFDCASFWFGENLKPLVFKMYRTEEGFFNYTAMLLDCCKDEDQVQGFVKALELSLGKPICEDVEEGKGFVAEVLLSRKLFEEQQKEHEENLILAKKAVSLLVDQIIDDYENPSLEIQDLSEDVSNQTDLQEGKILTEKCFSYSQIGFEGSDVPKQCYFLPLELVLMIVSVVPSWNLKVNDVEDQCFKEKIIAIFEECRNEQFNNKVLAFEFLHSDKFKEILGTTRQFLAHSPLLIVKEILEEKVEPEEVVEEIVEASTCEEEEERFIY